MRRRSITTRAHSAPDEFLEIEICKREGYGGYNRSYCNTGVYVSSGRHRADRTASGCRLGPRLFHDRNSDIRRYGHDRPLAAAPPRPLRGGRHTQPLKSPTSKSWELKKLRVSTEVR